MNNCYVSNYLNIIPLEETCLLFNGFNGCIDEVSMDLGDFLMNNKKVVECHSISQKEISFLINRGHLTNLSKDEEIEQFKKFAKKIDKHNMQIYSRQGELMFLLSYACNLDCYYCYQRPIRNKKRDKLMTIDLVDDLFGDYYGKLFGNLAKENIDILLYGGEPFLNRNRDVVERILKYAKEYSNEVGAISNCTHLEHYIDLLGPLPGMINFIQVSIDGNQENHDRSRIPENGQSTFDTILKNIHIMLDKKVKVNIRVNIESNSLLKLKDLYNRLEKEEILNHPYAYVYIHPLHNHFDQTDDSNFISNEKASQLLEEINPSNKIKHPIRRKAEGMSHIMNMKRGVPFRKTRFCMQNIPNNYIVDPYGDIYGCYEEAGREDAKIGSLKDGKLNLTSNKEQYLKRTILNIDKCLECPVGLLCGGECGVQAKEENGNIFDPYCGSRKREIYEGIKYLYTRKEEDFTVDNLNILFPNL